MVEPRGYAEQLAHGDFKAQDGGDAANGFCVVIPLPNVVGSLHMGHALMCTVEDGVARVARMRGQNALWLRGIDHAGIATQVAVEHLRELEGTERHTLGREKFLERVWAWKNTSGGRISEPLRVMGASCDRDRERFMMDEGLSRAVREAFVRLYDQALIYRSNRLVNGCVSCRTAISDLEADRDENVNG